MHLLYSFLRHMGKRRGTAGSLFHAEPTCYTTPTSVGMWIPTEGKCQFTLPRILCISNWRHTVGRGSFFFFGGGGGKKGEIEGGGV